MTEARRVAASWNWSVIAKIALVCLIVIAGQSIPIPGLEPEAVAACVAVSPDCRQGLSILALGPGPLISVLVLFQLAKLAIPGVARHFQTNTRALLWADIVIAAATLFLAAMQGLELFRSFFAMGLVSNDLSSLLVTVGSLVAGVAVLIFLSRSVEVPNLELGGFWLVLTIYWAPGVGGSVTALLGAGQLGAVSVPAIALFLGLLLAAVAATVFTATALRRRVTASGQNMVRWSPLLVWPPLIAGHIADFIAGLVYSIVPLNVPWQLDLVWMPPFILLLLVTIVLYARLVVRSGPDQSGFKAGRAVLAAIALVQIAICVGLALAAADIPFANVNGEVVIVTVIVLWSVWGSMRLRARGPVV
ncbi:hypothetical protein [Devosia sp.]|uniref:hypothetical protein n=1 Tax=Devosia sp. TaxID=1871048 RepID=UPI003A8E3CAD